jgi:Mycothiol maleylpyruvate isomerase N-terminal domain
VGGDRGHRAARRLRGPPGPGELAAWFDGTSTALLDVLGQDPESPAWTIYPPPTVGFWRRRRALETLATDLVP